MRIRIESQGVQELSAQIGRWSERIDREAKRAIQTSQRDVVVRARARHRFTSRSGEAERSIRSEPVRQTAGGLVGIVGTNRKITVFLHQGTAPHRIVPKRRRVLRFVANGRFVFTRRVQHPGWRADPFVERAFEHEKPRIVSRIEAALYRAMGG